MKIAVINGSPKGKAGNTNVVVNAFLKGAQEAGADTINIFLSEKELHHCKGCHVCWSRGPGQCVTKDDMLDVLSNIGGANIVVFATPVYFENISGMLKVFMDRMTMMGSPHTKEIVSKEVTTANPPSPQSPKLIMISSCGFDDRSEFQVLSHWVNRVALKMRMPLIGEIYTTQGKFLTAPPEEYKTAIPKYLQIVENAGKEIATDMKLSDKTQKLLEEGFNLN